jgi:hypothetical protein
VTDEEFVYELSQHDAETILATLEGTFGSLEETPQHILDAVEATGRVEFEYDEGEEPDGWEELSQQVSAIEDYLSSVPREQWAPSQGYEYDPRRRRPRRSSSNMSMTRWTYLRRRWVASCRRPRSPAPRNRCSTWPRAARSRP